MTRGNENTYNPECKDFDSYLGCCKHGDMKACRKKNCPKDIKLIEIKDGLFKDEKNEIVKSDDYWKLPASILKHFEKLDKCIHVVTFTKEEAMWFEGKEYPGIHVMTKMNHDAYYQKYFIDFIMTHGDAKFYFVRDNGFLLAEVENIFFVVAPFVPDPYFGESK